MKIKILEIKYQFQYFKKQSKYEKIICIILSDLQGLLYPQLQRQTNPMSFEEDVNKALLVANNKGRYQYVIMFLLCVVFYFDVFLFLGPSFYFMDPTFICDGSDEIVDESVACGKLAECHISTYLRYEANDFTITKYLGLYCDRQDQRDLIQSFLSVGSLIGLIVMNFVADLRGRRLAFIIDMFLAVCSISLTLIGTYSASTPLLIFASIMSGFSGYSLVIVSYIIAADICQEELRQKSSLYMNLSYSLGLMTFFIMYNWLNQWYNVLILFMLLPFAGLGIISFILIQESPNYYLCKRKQKKKCIQVLSAIALYNGKGDEQIEEIQKIITNSEKSQVQQKAQRQKKTVLSVLKQWQYLKIIIFVAITEAGGNLLFYGIQYAIDDIGFNYGIDNLVLGGTEVVVTLVLTKFISKVSRKKTCVIAYISTVAISFVFLFTAVQESNVICTLLIILIRTSTTIGYFMIVMFQTQSFPLEVQSIGAGMIEAFAQLGSISAPLIIAFAVNNGLQKMATLGVVLLVCLIPIKFVPEPKSTINKQQLSETMLQSQLEPTGD